MLRIVIFQMLFIFTAQFCVAGFSAETPSDTLVGLVVDKKGKAMKNVAVSYQGKDMQRTDKKGIFTFANVSLYDTLNLLLPKNRIWQIPVSGMPFLKITLRDTDFSTAEGKSDILDTGYGAVKKSRSTSGNVVLTGDELRETGQNDILQALAGKVSGLNLVYRDDGTQTVSIRGGTSFTLDNSPLFIVDGVTVESLNYVNINDVEQVTIMKEASIYGSRGANGAIVVKTK